MRFNPDQAKPVKEVTFLRKSNKIVHLPLYFNNATDKLTHTQKILGHGHVFYYQPSNASF